MPRDFSVYLCDMLEAAEKVARFIEGMTKESLIADDRTYDAVIRNLEIIGEAAKRIPDDFRTAHAEIPWRRLAGLRDMLIHQYSGIDHDIVWDVASQKLGPLINLLRDLLD